ncbi:MAG TPA: ATP-binding protein, partial [Brevundimonas sp.]
YPAYVDILVQEPIGVLRIIAQRERAVASQAHIFVLWLMLATVLLMSVAILFIRNQVRAIERLAEAAEAFGRGEVSPRFKPHGAREVRQAATAFLAMRDRIQRHIEQRTALLASVSHDLRTPLTRLRLELALAPPFKRADDMKGDLDEMEHMIDEYLAFARGEAGEAAQTVDIVGLLKAAGDDARRAGAEVEVAAPTGLSASLRPIAFKRAISNLTANAASHGDHVRLTARALPSGGLEIAVDDDGPGIPDELHEEAFMPFSRLDESRNQNSKGVGLGLAIARDVARGHGGDITLARSDMGGLRALIRLPG